MAKELDFDAAEKWVTENDAPDFVMDVVKGSPLRTKVQELSAEVTRLKPFEDHAVKEARLPSLETAFGEAGFDTSKLNKAQRKLLKDFEYEGDGPKPEDVKSYADEWEFPLKEEGTTTEPAPAVPASGRIAAAAVQATGQVPSEKNIQDKIAEAEEKGNFSEAVALKSQLLLGATS